MRTIDRVLLGAGLLIPFWLFFGVLLTASRFPGYSHVDLAMSQLGAMGAPTHAWSPWLNNLPLGVLFVLCALGLLRRFQGSRLAAVSALLVLVHGLASISAGVFPCDQGCLPAQPSLSQKLHNLSGLVMFVSLTLASASWIFLGRRLLGSVGFARFSLLCVLLSLATVGLMAGAMESGHGFGLYQRLNYGVAVIWLALLAWLGLRESGAAA
ncbi:DUF998 domain-containing protein [Pseudomonas sp. 148P]|uniref:DUF998 domain-containing protein n=1 Tax=Pseudomonas ulcerans TaxID=3115852 RepID=A0ABU7HQN5_9PSED|nr:MULTISPECIES: DUF998 domain-containing protein [unclassified Pseudomonas]MEE1923792.1 DUF998 domain-containing protein [Pseudomonas sp. 147P]MEE1933852.1 DUF998 domain-containing protein [Pseudomonas sp. 148P]